MIGPQLVTWYALLGSENVIFSQRVIFSQPNIFFERLPPSYGLIRPMRLCVLAMEKALCDANRWKCLFTLKIDIIGQTDIYLPYGNEEKDTVFQIHTILRTGRNDLVSFCSKCSWFSAIGVTFIQHREMRVTSLRVVQSIVQSVSSAKVSSVLIFFPQHQHRTWNHRL